ncbi:hypothetical protein B9Z55_015585 [Caenorhabditis nigoni]|uniref:Uncharacterized protein n=1 Tax=Caenorhabditis nigoni TaxID=1611254 RepID=A0A2G5UAX4_9PELO|nr:hypothetical protein B9Z55_015585 [Caenorhabditis nigoni]
MLHENPNPWSSSIGGPIAGGDTVGIIFKIDLFNIQINLSSIEKVLELLYNKKTPLIYLLLRTMRNSS